jgi:hypothetical protein
MNSKLNRLKRVESMAARSRKAEDVAGSKLDIDRLSIDEVNELIETKMQEARDTGLIPSDDKCSINEIEEIMDSILYRLRLKNIGKNLIGI